MMRIKRYLCLFLAVWFICQLSLVLAEEAAPVVPKGSGEASAAFSVQSSGAARLTLKQKRGIAREITFNMKRIIRPDQTPVPKGSKEKNQYITVPASTNVSELGEWGQYRLLITDPSGEVTEKEWASEEDGEIITLTLPKAGLYRIEVIPFTQRQMNASWAMNRFIQWLTWPEWEVAETRNCECVE